MTESKNLRVLIVDDNEAIHADFHKILGRGDSDGQSLQDARSAFFGEAAEEAAATVFDVHSASQGLDGIERAAAARRAGDPFALAFVDVRMPPGIDGIQTIKRVWDVDPDLQIVICTAYADYSLDEITGELGNSDRLLILKKPFDPVEVRQLACSLTEKWNSAARERSHMADVERYAASLEETNRKLQEANARAESASRVKSEFLANMSHEIRTPMTAVLGYIDLLFDEDVTDDESDSYKEIIRRSGQHLLVIINDILDLSKIEAGRMILFPEPFSVRTLAEEVVLLHEAAAEKKGLTLTTESADGFPETLYADPVRVRQVLSNLVGNAVKFTRAGSVNLHLALDGEGNPCFHVVDTGTGIPTDKLPTLFDAFTQADTSSTRKAGGTGLGLAISKQLAIMLGGDIEVRSEEGVGSTFTLRLEPGAAPSEEIASARPTPPAAGATPAASAPRAPLPDPGPAPASLTGRILLVEDGRLNQVLIATILRKAGADVDVADNGQDGCDRVWEAEEAGRPYGLVLMDMQMPVLDGYDATRSLRERGFERPVVALTAHAMSGDRQKCLDAGCSDYTTKPVDRRALIGLCHRLLVEGPGPRAPLPRGEDAPAPADGSRP